MPSGLKPTLRWNRITHDKVISFVHRTRLPDFRVKSGVKPQAMTIEFSRDGLGELERGLCELLAKDEPPSNFHSVVTVVNVSDI